MPKNASNERAHPSPASAPKNKFASWTPVAAVVTFIGSVGIILTSIAIGAGGQNHQVVDALTTVVWAGLLVLSFAVAYAGLHSLVRGMERTIGA